MVSCACSCAECSRLQAVKIMEAAKVGQHVNKPFVTYVQTPEFTLEPLSPEQRGEGTVNVDGENCGFSPLRVRCLNRLLPIVA